MNKLQKEFDYYVNNQKELVKKYNGKYIVIKDEEVVDSFDSELEAYKFGVSKFKPGTFLIQPCLPGSENYTQTFYSRMVV